MADELPAAVEAATEAVEQAVVAEAVAAEAAIEAAVEAQEHAEELAEEIAAAALESVRARALEALRAETIAWRDEHAKVHESLRAEIANLSAQVTTLQASLIPPPLPPPEPTPEPVPQQAVTTERQVTEATVIEPVSPAPTVAGDVVPVRKRYRLT